VAGPSSALRAVLEEARRAGHLGSVPIEDHLAHSARFAASLRRPVVRALDLGSGGGVPGLVLAEALPESRWVLVDRRQRRTDDLRRAVGRLGLADRVEVVCGDATALGHDAALRGSFDVVVARSFGSPAQTAEVAAGFLRPGGQLLVSEPPDTGGRWPEDGLRELGLALDGDARGGIQSLTQVVACPDRYPRRRPRPPVF